MLKVHFVSQIIHVYFELPCVTLAVFGVADGCLAEVRGAIEKKKRKKRNFSKCLFVRSMHFLPCVKHGPLCSFALAGHGRHAMRC